MYIVTLDDLVGKTVKLFKPIGDYGKDIPIKIGMHEMVFTLWTENLYTLSYLRFYCRWDKGEICSVHKNRDIIEFRDKDGFVSLETENYGDITAPLYKIKQNSNDSFCFDESLLTDFKQEMENILLYKFTSDREEFNNTSLGL